MTIAPFQQFIDGVARNIERKQRAGNFVATFDSPADFFAAMGMHEQYDAHVRNFRWHKYAEHFHAATQQLLATLAARR